MYHQKIRGFRLRIFAFGPDGPAGIGAVSPGDSARAGTLPCAGVAGRHALPRECRGARPFCGFSGRAVFLRPGRGRGGELLQHQHKCGAGRNRVPDGSGRQGRQGSRALPGRRRNEPGCLRQNRGPGTGHTEIHLPWEVYLCALSKIRRVGRAKTPTKTIARRVQTDIANNKKTNKTAR